MDGDVNGDALSRERAPAEGIALLTWPTLVYAPLTLALAGFAALRGGAARAAGGIAVGVLLWTLGEYFVHRFVEHGTLLRAAYVRNHLRHHAEPWPAEHFVYPLAQTLPIVPFVFGEAWLVSWEVHRALATAAGIIGCYLVNEWVHFVAHRPALTARRALLAWLARNHLRHHHEDARRHFGFFTTVWDRVFGSH